MSAQSSAVRLTGEVPRFDVVEAVTPVGTAPCFECRGPIVDTYYERDGRVICAACQRRLADTVMHSTNDDRFPRALAFGLGASVLGATLYFGLLAVTDREIELVAILVGFMVGKAVRHGSGGRGGRRYQWLAVALTYLAIASTYAPFVMRGFGEPTNASAAGVTALLLLAAVAPVLAGLRNVLGVAITIVALAQTWRMNRPLALEIAGPYSIRPTTARRTQAA